MKVQNTVIVPLKAVCLLNVNFPPSFAMLLVFCELHRCAQDCSGWKSTFFSSWLLLTFSRPLPTSLQRVWPCGWPAPPEYKSPVLPLGHKPLPNLVPPGLSYLHPNGLDREEGRTCKKKKPGCLNDCEETVHSQTTLDCAARQKQTWSQATQSVGLFITAPSLLWPLQQSPGKRDKAIYSQSTLFSPQNTYLKFLVETMKKKNSILWEIYLEWLYFTASHTTPRWAFQTGSSTLNSQWTILLKKTSGLMFHKLFHGQ